MSNDNHDPEQEPEPEGRRPKQSPLEIRANRAMAEWLDSMSPVQRAKVKAALAKASKGG